MIHRDWRSLSANELERAYDQSLMAPNMAEVLARCAQHSASAWQALGAPRRIAYGPKSSQAMDWFAPPVSTRQSRGAALIFLIHGGAWRSGEAKDYALGATALLAHGSHLVVPDFSSVLACDGDLGAMLEELKLAFALTQAMASAMGVDVQNIHVCGHSSGAHLAACLAVATANSDTGARHPMASLLCCSGLYDLEPVRHSARSAYLTLSDEAVHALSPIRHLKAFTMPVHLMCGTFELPEFMRQSHEFAQSLTLSAAPVRLSWVEGLNHFELLESMAQSTGPVHQAVLEILTNTALFQP